MLYEIIPLDPLPGLRGWYRLKGARGTLVALGAARVMCIPWLRMVVRCAGEASPMRVKSVRLYGTARPPCPSTSQCTCWGHMCDLPVRVSE